MSTFLEFHDHILSTKEYKHACAIGSLMYEIDIKIQKFEKANILLFAQ